MVSQCWCYKPFKVICIVKQSSEKTLLYPHASISPCGGSLGSVPIDCCDCFTVSFLKDRILMVTSLYRGPLSITLFRLFKSVFILYHRQLKLLDTCEVCINVIQSQCVYGSGRNPSPSPKLCVSCLWYIFNYRQLAPSVKILAGRVNIYLKRA